MADAPDFLEDFRREADEAAAIVTSRDKEGRNKAVSPKDQFESTEWLIGMIQMKLRRALSYLAAGNYSKFKEELQDSSNYALFCIIFEKPQGEWPLRDEDGKVKNARETFLKETTI